MADKKTTQLTMQEYLKIKAQVNKSKLKLKFPLALKIIMAIPLVYVLFLIIYYLVHVRMLAEH
jgi:hypothetical protein